MTSSEFFLRAVLSLASNPKYVVNGQLQCNDICREAENLFDVVDANNDEFDDITVVHKLDEIQQELQDIRKAIWHIN